MSEEAEKVETLPEGKRFNLEQFEIAETNARLSTQVLTPARLKNYLKVMLSIKTPLGRAKNKKSVMIWSSPGIGKTDIVGQIAREYFNARLVAIHLPQNDPTDLKGIPIYVNGEVRWVASSFLPGFITNRAKGEDFFGGDNKAGFDVRFKFPYAEELDFRVLKRTSTGMSEDVSTSFRMTVHDETNYVTINALPEAQIEAKDRFFVQVYEKAVLLIDELTAADIEVQKTGLQLVLEGQVGEYVLPPTCPVVAAGNFEDDGAYTVPMSRPLSNRFNHVRLVPSMGDWIGHELETGNANPEVLGFLSNYGSAYLNFPGELVQGDNGYPTPRSWSSLAHQLNRVQDFRNDENFQWNDDDVLIVGEIGKKMGSAFIAFRSMRESLPDVGAIMAGDAIPGKLNLDTPSQYLMCFMITIRLADMHKLHGVKSEHWVKAKNGFFNFLMDHVPAKDIRFTVVQFLRRQYKIKDMDMVCDGFDRFIADGGAKHMREVGKVKRG